MDKAARQSLAAIAREKNFVENAIALGYRPAVAFDGDPQIIRKAIQDGSVAILDDGAGSRRAFVGEDDGILFEARQGAGGALDVGEVSDASVPEGTIEIWERPSYDPIIYTPERDAWPGEYELRKDAAKQSLQNFWDVDACARPAHPVVIVFAERTEAQKKAGVRAMNVGPEILVFDPSDPLTEIVHEIGHAYYMSRLTDAERAACEALYKKTKKLKPRPGIFTNDYCLQDEEEFFCTIYQWWIKGKFVNPGFDQILANSFPEGHKMLNDIYDANKERYRREALDQWEQMSWESKKERVAKYLHKCKRAIVKAGLSVGLEPPRAICGIKIPRNSFRHVTSRDGRDWVAPKVETPGIDILVLNKDREIDLNYMAHHASTIGLYPVAVRTEQSLGGGRRGFSVKTRWESARAMFDRVLDTVLRGD